MLVKCKLSALKETSGSEYLVRFGLGGMTTLVAGLIADRYGPTVGGLFLAFPAIFCASATMIEKHERKHKQQRSLQGTRRGRDAAISVGECPTFVDHHPFQRSDLLTPSSRVLWFQVPSLMHVDLSAVGFD